MSVGRYVGWSANGQRVPSAARIELTLKLRASPQKPKKVVIVDPPYTVAPCGFQAIDILEPPYKAKVLQEHHEYELTLLRRVRFKKPYEC